MLYSKGTNILDFTNNMFKKNRYDIFRMLGYYEGSLIIHREYKNIKEIFLEDLS